jgi:hypothetical protein
VSIILALEGHVPAAAAREASRWLYAGDDPTFDFSELERVHTADAVMAAARELREPYLDTIGALSRLNASPEWWATHLAAKHPYPSLFGRLCHLAGATELATDGTLVVCSSPAQLAELASRVSPTRKAATFRARVRRRAPSAALQVAWPALRALGDRAPDAVRAGIVGSGSRARFALERVPGHRRRVLESLGARRLPALAGDRTALLVTWIDERCFGPGGEYRDPHLGPLATMLQERGLRVARLVKPLLHASFQQCAAAMLASGQEAAFADSYVSVDDWRDCERRVRSWRPSIPADIRVGEVPFARIAREYGREHRRAQVDALTHERLVARLAAAGVRPELVVFPWEGHAWEQVLTESIRRHMPDTQVVGYDNLNFSSLALSLYPSPVEADIRPLPDRVVTNGETFAAVLRASAFPQSRVTAGCALRHPDLATGEHPVADRAFVLAACSIDTAQSIELLRKAWAAFGSEFVARLHPASDAATIRAAVPSEVRFAPEPLSELLPHAKLMLYTYSVVPYEALAAGTPPVFVQSESMLDLDQLEPTPDVRWVARTPENLRAVADEIAAMPAREAWERRARDVVRAALAPPGPDCVERFLPEATAAR